jgi:hypothetical protein
LPGFEPCWLALKTRKTKGVVSRVHERLKDPFPCCDFGKRLITGEKGEWKKGDKCKKGIREKAKDTF